MKTTTSRKVGRRHIRSNNHNNNYNNINKNNSLIGNNLFQRVAEIDPFSNALPSPLAKRLNRVQKGFPSANAYISTFLPLHINESIAQVRSQTSRLTRDVDHLNKIVPKEVRLTSFGIEEKINVVFSGVAKDDKAVINMMNNFSENSVVNNSKIETLVEFTEKDRKNLYSTKGQPSPKDEDLPQENISKKFNSSLSLKPVEDEKFDKEAVLSKLLKSGKK